MKTIIVDHHDGNLSRPGAGRFNDLAPLLRTCKFPVDDLIHPSEINNYVNTHNIIYAITAKIPTYNEVGPEYNDRRWMEEIPTVIPSRIKELAKQKKLHIAFFCGEIITITISELLIEVDKQLLLAGLSREEITVYVPNFYIPQLDVEHIKFISIFEMSYYDYLERQGGPRELNVIQTVNLNKRNKKYTCLNHLSKTHRLAIAGALFTSGRHLDGNLSYHNTEYTAGRPSTFINTLDLTGFHEQVPFLIDTDDSERVQHHWDVVKPFFNDAYWNFVTESFFYYYAALTEKTFKPIANLQPFIIFGCPGSLKELRRLGYKTFGHVIDESYDEMYSEDRRMVRLVKLAFQLADMSDEEHIEMMTEIKPILEHNQRVFFSKTWKDYI